ncbi:MAG: tRNA (5-methylaminomethyl-2-thiouridine)(34)-methyltransferase MnmD [Balneolaceae bacterium]
MNNKLYTSKDGSTTIFNAEINQYYHNPNGAVSESLHIFFGVSGLIDFLESAKSLTILEVGFGTGLNFLLLLDLYQKRELNFPVRFFSIEAFPLEQETAKKLDFTGHLQNPELNKLLPKIFSELESGYNHIKPIEHLDVELHLFFGNFADFTIQNLHADFIFHDPFSPEVNKELWTAETFIKLKNYSSENAVLATYCSASKARAAMAASGWFVARAPGTLGKREMTLASLDETKLLEFKRVNEQKLAERYREGDF